MVRINTVITAVVMVMILVGGVQVISTATSDDMNEYVETSSEWCEERGGELVNVQSVVHGGLHCGLPNGTSVHMSEVVDTDVE